MALRKYATSRLISCHIATTSILLLEIAVAEQDARDILDRKATDDVREIRRKKGQGNGQGQGQGQGR